MERDLGTTASLPDAREAKHSHLDGEHAENPKVLRTLEEAKCAATPNRETAFKATRSHGSGGSPASAGRGSSFLSQGYRLQGRGVYQDFARGPAQPKGSLIGQHYEVNHDAGKPPKASGSASRWYLAHIRPTHRGANLDSGARTPYTKGAETRKNALLSARIPIQLAVGSNIKHFAFTCSES